MRTFFEDFFHGLVTINSSNDLKTAIAQWRDNHSQFRPTIIHNKNLLPWHSIIPFFLTASALVGEKGYRTDATIPNSFTGYSMKTT